MKLSELQEYLKDYPKTVVNGRSLGCDEMIIRTSTVYTGRDEVVCEPSVIVDTHFKQIKEFIDLQGENVSIYVRTGPELRRELDDEGEDTGQYSMRTRLQYGIKGKCITQEQYDHLSTFEGTR